MMTSKIAPISGTVSRLYDSGAPAVLVGTGMESAFRYWEGLSGEQYLFRISDLHDMSETEQQVVIIARRSPDGRREALWVGMGGTLEAYADMKIAMQSGANELHIHALADSAAARGQVIDDLRSNGRPVFPFEPLLDAA